MADRVSFRAPQNGNGRRRSTQWLQTGLILGIVAFIVWFAGGTLFPDRGKGGAARIVVYGFSIVGEPLREDVFPLFRKRYLADTGRDVEFLDSFAASGIVTNQIINGTPADVAILSHPGDADRLVQARCARHDWREGPHGGILNRTPMVIAVRKGNPKGIRDFASLGRPDVSIVHPDPTTSGGAQWGVFAEYAEPLMLARAKGRTPSPDVAHAQLLSIWRNVTAQAPSARAARTQFDQGFGDALVTYEVEVLLDRQQNQDIEIVVPPATILSEHPIVVIDRNVRKGERDAVDAFVRFLYTEEAQAAFVRHGFRAVLPGLDAANPHLARLEHPYTIGDLGGWTKAQQEIVEDLWKGRLLAEARK